MRFDPAKLESEWLLAFSKAIPISQDRAAGLIGERLAQVTYHSRRGPSAAWDLREQNGVIRVFQSELNDGLLSNYTPLNVPSETAREFLSDLEGKNILTLPHDSKYWGLDGESCELQLFYGFASVSLRWWSTFPEQWTPIIQRVDKFLQELTVAPTLHVRIVIDSVLSSL